MSWILWLAKKFLGRRGSVLKTASLISACGISFAVMATLVTLAVVTGFEKEYERSILGFNSHIILVGDEETHDVDVAKEVLKSASDKGIKTFSPYVYREGLAMVADDLQQIVLKGVDRVTSTDLYPIKFSSLTSKDQVSTTTLFDLSSQNPRVILGRELLESFYPDGIPPKPTIRVLVPKHEERKTTSLKDYLQVFDVVGTFESGLHEFDAKFALMDIAEMNALFQLGGRVTGLEVLLADPYQAPSVARFLEEQLGGSYQAISWNELNEPLFQAMKMEKTLFVVIMLLVTLVASVNVMGVVLMLILNRKNEAAILLAMGAREKDLRRIFTLQGLFVGLSGVVFGSVLAAILLWTLDHFKWFELDPQIYFIKTLPVTWPWELWGLILLVVVAMIAAVSRLATHFLARDQLVGVFR